MYRLRILFAALALLAGALACGGAPTGGAIPGGGGPTATPTRTATPTPTRTATPVLPVNLAGTWQATLTNQALDPPPSGHFTLTITQTAYGLTCTAASDVAPAVGSDYGCGMVVNNLVPTNNHIDVRFTIQFLPYQQYYNITVSFDANFITDDRRRMSGDFEMDWHTGLSATGFYGTELFVFAP